MDGTNFYLASAAVIPIIALVQATQRTVTLRPGSEPAVARLRRTVRAARVGNAAWKAAELALFIVAEFVCLRHLQVGHSPFGGSSLVWVTLAYGAGNTALIQLGTLVEEEDIHALTSWLERKGFWEPRDAEQPRSQRKHEPPTPG